MLVYISGQLVNGINGGSSGIPSLDQNSQQWKDNAEGWLNYLFGIPKGAFDTNQQGSGLTQHIADNITQALGGVAKDVGIWLIHMSPGILLIVCMGSILGMMIGSERCKHWASVSALGTLVMQVVNHLV